MGIWWWNSFTSIVYQFPRTSRWLSLAAQDGKLCLTESIHREFVIFHGLLAEPNRRKLDRKATAGTWESIERMKDPPPLTWLEIDQRTACHASGTRTRWCWCHRTVCRLRRNWKWLCAGWDGNLKGVIDSGWFTHHFGEKAGGVVRAQSGGVVCSCGYEAQYML